MSQVINKKGLELQKKARRGFQVKLHKKNIKKMKLDAH